MPASPSGAAVIQAAARPRPSDTHRNAVLPSHLPQRLSTTAFLGSIVLQPISSRRTPGGGLMDQCSHRHDIPSALGRPHQPAGARSKFRSQPSLQAAEVLTGRRLGDQRPAILAISLSTARWPIPIRRLKAERFEPAAVEKPSRLRAPCRVRAARAARHYRVTAAS